MTDDGLPQFETLEDHTVYWVQRVAADIRATESFYRQVGDTASRQPFLVARELWRATKGRRRLTRHFLRHIFGYDPQAHRGFVRCYQDRWPQVSYRWDEWRRLERQYHRDSAMIAAMLQAFRLAISQGRDPSRDMVEAWLRDQQMIVAEGAHQLAPWNDGLTREGASVWLAGYVYAHLSFQYPRLRDALGGRNGRQLAARLPSAVFEAWVSGAAQGDAALLPRAAERVIEGRAERKRQRRRDRRQPAAHPQEVRKVLDDLQAAGLGRDVLDWLQHCWVAPPLSGGAAARREDAADGAALDMREDVARRSAVDDAEMAAEVARRAAVDDAELAAGAARLMAEPGLSERQAQVVYLVWAQGGSRGARRAAAARLGIDDDTARQHLHRARRKMRAAV